MRRFLTLLLAVTVLVLLLGCAPVSVQDNGGEIENLNSSDTEPTETTPKYTKPEQTVPEETEPNETTPEETTPEQSISEDTEPDQVAPEDTEPDQVAPEDTKQEQNKPDPTPSEQVKPNTHTHSYEVSMTVDASCVQEGSTTYACDCGDSYIETIEKKAHKWGAWYVVEQATTTKNGERRQNCRNNNCNAQNIEQIEKLNAAAVSTEDVYSCVEASVVSTFSEPDSNDTFCFQYYVIVKEMLYAKYEVSKIEVLSATVCDTINCVVYQTKSQTRAEEIGVTYVLADDISNGYTIEEAKQEYDIKDFELVFIIGASDVPDFEDEDEIYEGSFSLRITFSENVTIVADFAYEVFDGCGGLGLEVLGPGGLN